MTKESNSSSVAAKGRYILSLGAGVNSTALLFHIFENGLPLDEVVFADTGAELPETYQTVRLLGELLKARDIPLTVVKSKVSLYDTAMKRRVLPSRIWRWQTRDKKVVPIHAHYRSLKAHIYEYIGICYDEIRRVKPSKEPYITTLYPLVDAKITREGCLEIIKRARFPVPIKSGCFFCPFADEERWEFIKQTYPDLYQSARELEEANKHFPKQTLRKGGLRTPSLEIVEENCENYCQT